MTTIITGIPSTPTVYDLVGGNIDDIAYKPVKWLLEPFYQTNANNILHASGGSGKTFFALWSLAQMSKLDHVCVYVIAENGNAYLPRFDANLIHLNANKNNIFIYEEPVIFSDKESINKFLYNLRLWMNKYGHTRIDHVKLDTLKICATNFKENDNDDMTKFLTIVNEVGKLIGSPTFEFIHHDNKAGTNQHRGASAIIDNMLCSLAVNATKAQKDKGLFSVEIDKQNSTGLVGSEYEFKLVKQNEYVAFRGIKLPTPLIPAYIEFNRVIKETYPVIDAIDTDLEHSELLREIYAVENIVKAPSKQQVTVNDNMLKVLNYIKDNPRSTVSKIVAAAKEGTAVPKSPNTIRDALNSAVLIMYASREETDKDKFYSITDIGKGFLAKSKQDVVN